MWPRQGYAGCGAAPVCGSGSSLSGRDVHHHERIERDLQPPRLQFGDQMRDARVRRRAAERRPALDRRDQVRGRARQSRHRPDERIRALAEHLDAGLDRAGAGAQIVAEPGDHDGDALQVRARRLQIVERGDDIGRRMRDMAVFGLERAEAVDLHHFGRARSRTRWCRGSASPRASCVRAGRSDGRSRTTIAECGCRNPPAAAARTPHRRARDRPAPRPAWRRSAHRAPASRCRDRCDD